MKIILLIIFILFIGCTSTQIDGEVHLIDKQGMKLVPAKINDKHVLFILDTGAKTSTLDDKISTNLGIAFFNRNDEVHGIGGSTKLYKSEKFRFQILGDTVTYSMNVANLNSVVKSFRNIGTEICGVLGADFLKINGCIINYRTNTLDCRK